MHSFIQNAVGARRSQALFAVLVAGLFLIAGLFAATEPAAAQQGFGNFFGYQTPKRPKRRAVRRRSAPEAKTADTAQKDKKDEAAKDAPAQPVYAIVSLADQHISVYDANGRIAQSRVSTGARGHRTPSGVFSVIGRSRYHRSNIYSGAPMPWMQRITWSGIAMHAGVVPGYPASHGCIRLPYSFAPQLWKMTKMGARVVVAARDTKPEPISHAFLPAPRMHDSPTAALAQEIAANMPVPKPHIELASLSEPIALTTAPVAAAEPAARPAKLDPMAYAKALKIRAKIDKDTSEAAAKAALQIAQTTGAEARQATAHVAKGEADLAKAQAEVADAEAAVKAATAKLVDLKAEPAEAPVATLQDEEAPAKQAAKPLTPEEVAAKAAAEAKALTNAEAAVEAAKTAEIAAHSELARATAALEEARRREAEKTPAAFAAVEAYKQAKAAAEAAGKLIIEAERRREPVSIFISRKEGRVFIRQDWKEVYEAPVTIRDPEQPLGTHVYIALAAEDDGSAMRWSAITVPESAPDAKKKKGSAKAEDIVLPKRKSDATADADANVVSPAAAALDRLEIPAEARERIADLLWTGASLIVSDHPRSYEMGEYTDFIVLTR